MSAEIIDLREWRRDHRPLEQVLVKKSLPLLPTWPWGWFLPVLIEMTFEQWRCGFQLTINRTG